MKIKNKTSKMQSQAGFTLLSTLGLLLLISTISIALLSYIWTVNRETGEIRNEIETEYLVEAAYQYFLFHIANGEIDLNQSYPITQTFELLNENFEIIVINDDTRLNISRAPADLLITYLVANGFTEIKAGQITAAIMDWRDPDNLTRPDGAEAAEYRLQGKEGFPGNAPFSSVEQLRQVMGFENSELDEGCFFSDLTVFSNRAMPYGSGMSVKVSEAVKKVGNNLIISGREGLNNLKVLRLFITPKRDTRSKTWEIVLRLYGRRQAFDSKVLFWQRAFPNWQDCL